MNDKVYHKSCFKCSKCGVRLRMEVTKQTQDGTIFCERDWNEGGHGGIGVKHNVGNDSMAISAAKRSEQIKRDATMSDTKEVHGSKAGQQKNSQQST